MACADLLRMGLLVLLTAMASPALAWTTPAATSTPAATVLAPNAAVDAASQVATLVDAGRMGELWDGASPAMKRVVTRAAFVDGIAVARKRQGAVTTRQWLTVRRQLHDGKQDVPAGHYVSIELLAQLSDGAQMRELVSLRIDEDGTARLSGYAVE